MLYWLGYEVLFRYYTPFRVFQYSTFRTAMASLTALLLSLWLGPRLIRWLQEFQIQQHIRTEGPQSHQKKAGTPTMGGLLICGAIIVPTLLWANLSTAAVWVALTSVVLYGSIGFWDDYTKVTRKRNLGLTVRQKFGLEILAAVVIGLLLLWMNSNGAYSTELNVPFFKNFKPDPVVRTLMSEPWSYAVAFIPFFAVVVLVLAGSSEGVNLADGLDGLAIGLMLIVGMAMTALAFVSGNAELSRYLEISRTPGASELTIFCGALTKLSKQEFKVKKHSMV